jgi:serine acetyltransferase
MFPHFYGISIHSKAQIGDGVVIRQLTTIGGGNRYISKNNRNKEKRHYVLAPKIGDGVELGANVFIIENSRIRKNCIIGAGTTIANSKIGNNTKIGPGCVISRCKIGDNCKIRAGAVLYNVEVPPNSIVESPKPIIRKSLKQ